MKTRTRSIRLAIGFVMLTASASASAGPGMALDSAKLAPETRTALKTSIDKARAASPATFREVREIVLHAREADRRARGRKAATPLVLSSMGTKALLPILELVAFDAPPPAAGESAADRASVQRDLVEALGLLRDTRATPVLLAVLAREADYDTTRTAAEALARMDSDEAASALVAALASSTGERATAILAGMGSCRRVLIATTLADRLAARPGEATARSIVKSLAHVGNAWAWKTLANRGEEAASRETAARALVSAYMYYTGEVREAAAKALLVVDDAHTDTFIQEARRGAPADAARALDALARRLADNPTHAR